jgi:DNA invertase Pin-like site-specific DNA recombinase
MDATCYSLDCVEGAALLQEGGGAIEKKVAIYVRRSVSDKLKGNNSHSIISQKEDCVRSLRRGEDYRVYCDDGKSGGEIEHREAFLQMMGDAREGLISRVVVKKLDRFSRSIRDFYNVVHELQDYGVNVHSLEENIDTSTIAGQMARSFQVLINEGERLMISARVADAYATRSIMTGFYLGGKRYYGYEPERRTVNGKTGSVLVPSERAGVVQDAYRLYSDDGVSLADVMGHFRDNGIETCVKQRATSKHTVNASGKSNLDRSQLSNLLASPLYVRANHDVYRYFAAKGYDIKDDISAFDGVHGLFRHKCGGGWYLKVGYHEGLVDSETWLAVQDKKSRNKRIPKGGGAKNSWLVGLVKCGHCGYALNILYNWNAERTKQWRYYIDSGAYRANGCVKKRLKTRPGDVEAAVYDAIARRLALLEIAKVEASKPDGEIERLKAGIARKEAEIGKLVANMAQADGAAVLYISKTINALHGQKSDLEQQLDARARRRRVASAEPLKEPIARWEFLTMQEKRALARALIETVHVSDENGIEIKFSL